MADVPHVAHFFFEGLGAARQVLVGFEFGQLVVGLDSRAGEAQGEGGRLQTLVGHDFFPLPSEKLVLVKWHAVLEVLDQVLGLRAEEVDEADHFAFDLGEVLYWSFHRR